MTHWIVAPIVLPAMLAALIVLAVRHHILLQRVFSLAGSVALLGLTAGLAWRASDGTITLYQLGDWAAPFGIVLVADRLSTLMALLTAVLAIPVLLYAIGSGWDNRGRHFHALFQFQLMGIMGAFLTGDAFNLFVFFEVLLIASYGLMLHSGGTERLRAGLQYMIYNLLGSTLFLFALGTIYAETGTLNMADLAQRVAGAAADETAGLRVAAVLLLLVFAIKAALLPLHFWLPSSYAMAPGPVAALFAVMTKIGAYGIIRFYTLVFPPGTAVTEGLFDTWLLPAALASLALGMAGVLAARSLDRTVAFAVVGSMGMLLTSVAVFTPEGIAAALYYAIHSTLATAALFLLVDVVRERRKSRGVDLEAAPLIPGGALVAGLFFAAAIAMTGLPPLSGFVGKLLILDAASGTPLMWWVWAVVLGSSLVAVVGFARAGSTVFWKGHEIEAAHPGSVDDPEDSQGARELHDPVEPEPALPMVAIGLLIALLVGVTLAAGPVNRYLAATAAQLFDPAPYVATVLDTPGKQIVDHHATDGAEDHGAGDDNHGSDTHGTAAGSKESH
ncbi:monovalent cation/H+ antiporter subunit D [Pseudooceanicola sp. 216_PA32_1]|uniref:Monovalent cation/H+ antiporter subunit D n=1 Tax=Pseudooceanicola pacificus TaxID=2676438 RepID=A0A844WET9_9RHOB|nr:monovalent cation/H+ antiporter subunit D [Pseudooceanicola pacificus]MWB79352.1 monovalent cation/H+ antiporter subunit D [Pseudooceanicola pacificus]